MRTGASSATGPEKHERRRVAVSLADNSITLPSLELRVSAGVGDWYSGASIAATPSVGIAPFCDDVEGVPCKSGLGAEGMSGCNVLNVVLFMRQASAQMPPR